MNPNNGEILAMANAPGYDPNNPYEGYEILKETLKMIKFKICGEILL